MSASTLSILIALDRYNLLWLMNLQCDKTCSNNHPCQCCVVPETISPRDDQKCISCLEVDLNGAAQATQRITIIRPSFWKHWRKTSSELTFAIYSAGDLRIVESLQEGESFENWFSRTVATWAGAYLDVWGLELRSGVEGGAEYKYKYKYIKSSAAGRSQTNIIYIYNLIQFEAIQIVQIWCRDCVSDTDL